ncbi:hypothetical protein RJ639_039748 [Escallonia herrerae]|uniref:Uncharacterized protein n=1 Tax=Escallonia herrerae TaxID=1293975 RepID=A0AA88WN21_9ASTE|nr:hypothetical protein RJ639_039748 [Escallonia herrerae]
MFVDCFVCIPTINAKSRQRRCGSRTSLRVISTESTNVLIVSKAVRQNRFDNDWVVEGEAEVLPPHEVVVAVRQSPVLACSVMEGVGRTLKGRDLHQVRDTVWRTQSPEPSPVRLTGPPLFHV